MTVSPVRVVRFGSNVRHRFASSLVLLVGLIAMLSGRTAFGQGTMGMLPEPISTSELMRYADRLRLSEQQRQALEALHDEYKVEFRTLREGEIDAFLKRMHELQNVGAMPRRADVEEFMKIQGQVSQKIEAVDNRLFDRMLPLLNDEQIALVPRVKNARVRERLSTQQFMWMSGQRAVDLSELVLKIEISAEEQAAADTVLASYESRLTADFLKLYENNTGIMSRMYDAMEQMGLNEQAYTDPEQMQKVQEAMQQIWKDIMRESSEISAEISELNHRSFRGLVSTLGGTSARALREAYYTRAYPEATFAMYSATDRRAVEGALKYPDLTAEQRQIIEAAAAELRTKLDALCEEVVALIDENRKNFSPFEFDNEAAQKHQEKIAQLSTKASEVRTSILESARAALGPELAAKVEAAAMAAAAQGEKAAAEALAAPDPDTVSVSDSAATLAEEQEPWGFDAFLPSRIAERELKRYAEVLELSEAQIAVLESLLEDYAERFKAIEGGEIAKLTQATSNLWKFDENGEAPTPPSDDQIREVYRFRRAALDAIRALDKFFMDEIETTLLEESQKPKLARVRAMRDRQTWQRAQDYGWAMGQAAAGAVDLTRLVGQLRLDPAGLSAAEPVLISYEMDVTQALGARHEAAMAFGEATDRWGAAAQRLQSEDENWAANWAKHYRQIMGDTPKQMRDASQTVADINLRSLDEIVAALPADSASRLRAAYLAKAYPDVYNDPFAVNPVLDRALGLSDLSAEQRGKLESLAADHRPAYSQLSEQMVEATPGQVMWYAMEDTDEQPDWSEWQKKQEALAKLRFDRSELCQRAFRQIQTILSAEQVQRIGGIPKAPEDDGNPWN